MLHVVVVAVPGSSSEVLAGRTRVLPPVMTNPVPRGHWPVRVRAGSRLFATNGGTLVSINTTDPSTGLVSDGVVRVQVGIDAAVVANHQVTIRETTRDGQVQLSRFHAPPTIAGLTRSFSTSPHFLEESAKSHTTVLQAQLAAFPAGAFHNDGRPFSAPLNRVVQKLLDRVPHEVDGTRSDG